MEILIGDDWAVGNCEVSSSIQHPAMSQRNHQEHSQDASWMASENNFNSDIFPSSSNLPSDASLPSSTPRVTNMDALVSRTARTKPRKANSNIAKCAELPGPVWDFMNVNSCLRRVFLQWFRPELPLDYPKELCCSNCNPALDLTNVEFDIGEDPVARPDDHCPELETRFRNWLQSWIDIHIRQYVYPPLPKWLFSRTYVIEMARYSFPAERASSPPISRDSTRVSKAWRRW